MCDFCCGLLGNVVQYTKYSGGYMYHYVYRITNKVLNKHYYGKRGSTIKPELDIGIVYFSSSSDKVFMKDQKENPQNYKYKVVSVHSSSYQALLKEVRLHYKFDVGVNKNFYNKAKQSTAGADRTGISPANKGKPRSDEVKKKVSEANKGRTKSPETITKLKKALSGRKFTEEHKQKIGEANRKREWKDSTREKLRVANSGLNHVNSIPANVYTKEGELVASGVALAAWARANGYDSSVLCKTTKADRSKPSSKTNCCYHKGLYAVYIPPLEAPQGS